MPSDASVEHFFLLTFRENAADSKEKRDSIRKDSRSQQAPMASLAADRRWPSAAGRNGRLRHRPGHADRGGAPPAGHPRASPYYFSTTRDGLQRVLLARRAHSAR